MTDDASLRQALTELARQAGDAILEVYRSDFAVTRKSDASPVTAADFAAQRVIVQGLARFAEALPVVSEEAAAAPWSERRGWRRYWLVDPLDGTREFVKRNGEFTVNIALIEDHIPVAGVVFAPVSNDLYVATRGQGAFMQKSAGADFAPIRVRTAATPPVMAGSRSHGVARQSAMLAQLGGHETFELGSSLKFCVIARGDADGYLRLGPTSEWDTGAGQCVLEAAGGAVWDLAGVPLRYNTRDTLLNPEFLAVGDGTFPWRERLELT